MEENWLQLSLEVVWYCNQTYLYYFSCFQLSWLPNEVGTLDFVLATNIDRLHNVQGTDYLFFHQDDFIKPTFIEGSWIINIYVPFSTEG